MNDFKKKYEEVVKRAKTQRDASIVMYGEGNNAQQMIDDIFVNEFSGSSKTIKAPDKIYLSVDPNEEWKYAMWTEKKHVLDKQECYIRKDTLLEWAKEMADDEKHSLAYRGAFRDLISKLESL